MEFVLPLPPYNSDGSPSFKKWSHLQQRFKNFCCSKSAKPVGLEMCNLSTKLSVFRHLAGVDVNEIISSHVPAWSCQETAINNLLADLENRCLPSFILLYERFKFFTHEQKSCDDVNKFISELQWLGENCELQEHKEKYILGRIINGLHNDSFREKLKSMENLDMEKIFETLKEFSVIKDSTTNCEPRTGKKRGRKKRDVGLKENQLNKAVSQKETDCRAKRTRAVKGKQRGSKKTSAITYNSSEDNEGQDKVENKSILQKPTLSLRQTRSRTLRNQNTGAAKGQTKSVSLNIETEEYMPEHNSSIPQKPSEVNFVQVHISPSKNDKLFTTDSDMHPCEDTLTLTSVPEEDVMAEICNSGITDSFTKQENTARGFKFEYIEERDLKTEAGDMPNNRRDNEKAKEKYSTGKCTNEAVTSEKCPICGKICATSYSLKSHMRVHTRQRLYKCEACDLSFIHSGTRSRHMRQMHPDILKYKCDECGMLFEVQSALNLHKLSHSKDEEIECEDCGKVFMSTRDHYHHRRKEHRNTRYTCDVCGLHFPYPSKLKIHHMAKHNATKPFMCEICGSSFAEKNLLATHKNIHTGEKKYECNRCGRRFLLKTTLNNHLQTHLDHKPHTCHICGLNFKLSYYLKSHMKTHSNNRERPYICSTCGVAFYKAGQLRNHERKHTGEKPFKCDICNTMFSQLSSLNKHVKQIHEGVKPKNRFSCEFCGLSFTHSCKLKLHLMKHTGERPFQCKICGSTYRENHQLTSHMKIHNGCEPFKCHICGRRFLQKSYLEGHVRRHTGEKPFKCPICNAGFTQKGYLRDHLKVHDQNRERKYKCSVCSKAFTCSSHMRSHERLHTGEKPYKCDICGSRFTKRSSVKKHLRRTHGIQDPDSHQIHEPVSQGIQDSTATSVAHSIPHQSVISISSLQPLDITPSTIQAELQNSDVHNQSQLCAHAHPEMQVELQADLSGQIGADMHSEMNAQIHPELGTEINPDLTSHLHLDMTTSLHAVHTSISQQMHQHESINISYPELHSGIHSTSHPQLQPQIHPGVNVMGSEATTHMQHSDIVQEIQVFTMAS